MSRDNIGSARWMRPKEAEDYSRYNVEKFYLGRSPTLDLPSCLLPAVGYRDKRHVFIAAGTRAGKGVSFLVPNIITWKENLVVFDMKGGENAEVTAARRGQGSQYCQGLGQTVRVLDPWEVAAVDPALRTSYNPLDDIDPGSENAISDVENLVEALNPVIGEEKTQGESASWAARANDLLAAVIMHVLTTDVYEGKDWFRRDLLSVHDLIIFGDREGLAYAKKIYPEKLKAWQQAGGESSGSPKPVEVQTGVEMALMAMERNQHPKLGITIRSMAETALTVMRGSPRQWAGEYGHLRQAVSFLNKDQMRRALRTPEERWSLRDLKRERFSLYLVGNEDEKTIQKPWVRMMADRVIKALQREALVEKKEGRDQRQVLMIMEEFGSYGRIKEVEATTSTIAGRGVKYVFVCQHFHQLLAEDSYGSKAHDIYGDCGLQIHFHVKNSQDAEMLSKRLGPVQVELKTTSYNRSRGRNWSQTKTVSTAHTLGLSWQKSEALGSTQGTAHSRNRTSGRGNTVSHGHGFTPALPFLEFVLPYQLQIGRNENRGAGRNWNQSTSFGETINRSTSVTDTVSEGGSKSTTETVSDAETQGGSENETEGWSTQHHKTQLAEINEVEQWFKQIESPEDANYPGLALVFTDINRSGLGNPPMIVRRTNYWEDPLFKGLYDKHPEHDFLSYEESDFVREFEEYSYFGALREKLGEKLEEWDRGRVKFQAVDRRQSVLEVKEGDWVQEGRIIGYMLDWDFAAGHPYWDGFDWYDLRYHGDAQPSRTGESEYFSTGRGLRNIPDLGFWDHVVYFWNGRGNKELKKDQERLLARFGECVAIPELGIKRFPKILRSPIKAPFSGYLRKLEVKVVPEQYAEYEFEFENPELDGWIFRRRSPWTGEPMRIHNREYGFRGVRYQNGSQWIESVDYRFDEELKKNPRLKGWELCKTEELRVDISWEDRWEQAALNPKEKQEADKALSERSGLVQLMGKLAEPLRRKGLGELTVLNEITRLIVGENSAAKAVERCGFELYPWTSEKVVSAKKLEMELLEQEKQF